MDLISLGTLKNKILLQADMANSTFIDKTDSATGELTIMIQDSIKSLYDMLVRSFEDYFITEIIFNTVSGQRDYDFTTDVKALDFYKMVGLDFVNSAGRVYPLRRFLFRERLELSNMMTGSNQGYNLFYNIMGTKIRILPIPSAVFPLTLTYIPNPVVPSADKDTFDMVQGWDTWVIFDCVVKCLMKEESDVQVAMAERQKAEDRIMLMMQNRDEGEAMRILNVWDSSSIGRRVGKGSNTPPEEI